MLTLALFLPSPLLLILGVMCLGGPWGCSEGPESHNPMVVETQMHAATPTPTIDPALQDAWSFIRNGRPDVARVRIRGTVTGDDFSDFLNEARERVQSIIDAVGLPEEVSEKFTRSGKLPDVGVPEKLAVAETGPSEPL